MAEHPHPIVFQELVQLQNLGIDGASIVFKNLTIESEKWICVRECINGDNSVVIIDLKDVSTPLRRPITADSVIMHPIKRVLALKSGCDLQVFDLEAKLKLAACQTQDIMEFWRWLSPTMIGMVSKSSCYQWAIDPPSPSPIKLFEINADLSNSQIINFRSNPTNTWMFLVGISAQQGRVVGKIQLFNTTRAATQIIDGHAACFADFRVGSTICHLFAFASRGVANSKLHIIEIDRPPNAPPALCYEKKSVDIFFPPEAVSDFPVALHYSAKYGILFLVTKFGYIHLYDIDTAACIYMNRISGETVFATADFDSSSGVIGVNRKGQVLSVAIEESTLVPFIRSALGSADLALRVASRCGLSGADDLYVAAFEQNLAAGKYAEAAKLAATSPNGMLRTIQVIERLRQIPVAQNQVSPLLHYLGVILESGSLNKHETMELVRPIVAQGKKAMLEKWLKEEKLAITEELGDLIRTLDAELALSVYKKARNAEKVVLCLVELGRFDQIVPFSTSVSYRPDYLLLLQSVSRSNSERAVEFASKLAFGEPPALPVAQIVDVFMANHLIQQATAFLLEYLKENRPEHAALQTKVIEINLTHAPQVADAILGNGMFSYYDKLRVAKLCESAGLMQRALEHYSDTVDIKRCLNNANQLNADWIVSYFGNLSIEQSLECLKEMLTHNLRQNLQVAVKIAVTFAELLDPNRLIALFESFRCNEGIFYFLGSIINVSKDPEVHLKYIQAAAKTSQFKEVERVCRESNYYDPEKVKNFLKEANLADQLPLIIVCDRFNFVQDLVLYLHKANMLKYVEDYVQKVNPARTPAVIGALLDVGCDELVIKQILMSVQSAPVNSELLINEVESRNRIKFLLPWLEMKSRDGTADTPVYNALAKIYIDTNMNPESFLRENKLYDPRIIGRYCEKRNPHLAFEAYQQGLCDEELISITNRESMFKQQARYIVKRRDKSLWNTCLSVTNSHRKSLIDQVTCSVLPESQDPEEVSVAVKAFRDSKLFTELINLLEKIVLEDTAFSDNECLQNLLIITAIQTNKTKVNDYINRLTNYTSSQIASLAISSGLYEEAFTIYKRCNVHDLAVAVLAENMRDLKRAEDYCEKVSSPEAWIILGGAQLREGRVSDAIESYIRVQSAADWEKVLCAATNAECWEDLLEYLLMARAKVRDPTIESSLLFCYAKTNKLAALEDFLRDPNIADLTFVGERCYSQRLYSAAKILFTSVSNWSRLALTLVHLGEYTAAVECASKANSVKIWKEIHILCLKEKEFKLAQICGLQLVLHAEELETLCQYYEAHGYVKELITLLELALNLERAHMGIFTELSILYTKYESSKLEDMLKIRWQRLNLPKVIRAAEAAHLWREVVFLYTRHEEHENAALVMINHSVVCFEHSSFKDLIVKARNSDSFYCAIRFYLDEHPSLLNDLLITLSPKLDHSRVVLMFQKSHNIPLIKEYLVSVLSSNNVKVNEAYHELLIETGDYRGLRLAIESNDNFDLLDLAGRLSEHEQLEFRRVAAQLYKKIKKFRQAIALAKKDGLFRDAIDLAADSRDPAVAEGLLEYFAENKLKEHFVTLTYYCYEMLRADVVMELAWRYGWMDLAMPYMIQTMRDLKTESDSGQRRKYKNTL